MSDCKNHRIPLRERKEGRGKDRKETKERKERTKEKKVSKEKRERPEGREEREVIVANHIYQSISQSFSLWYFLSCRVPPLALLQ